MRSNNTFGIQFVIRMRKQQKSDLAEVYVRITVNKCRCEIALKKKVDPCNWDEGKGQARAKSDELKKLNNHLELVRSQIAECYHELDRQKKAVTAETVKILYLGEGAQEHTLLNLVEYHNTHFKETLSVGTLKNYFTTQKYIIKFLKEKKRVSDLHLSELNYQFIIDFERFLRNHQPVDHHKGLSNNGVMKHLERMRKMAGLAVRMEWMEKEPFNQYQLKFQRVDKHFLTIEELSRIEKKSFSIHRLQWTRDVFVFCCYTGLAYSDVMNLKHTHIQVGIDGEQWIRTSRQKTNTPVNTPLLPEALEIMERYRNDARAIANGTVFPNISNQKLNSYLKEIADLCDIQKHLTFHLARHTFATSITLANGVPIETVSKMLGHTKISTTQIYARVLEKKIGEDMALLKSRRLAQQSPDIPA